jgi:predicted Zn finger-like uncharacterized protein
MIVTCPGCGKRYRLEDARAAGRRLRCTGCGRIFDSTAVSSTAPTARAGAPAAAPGHTPLVLVADEAREFRDLVRHSLEALGCRVEVTDDGEAAFRFAVARRPVALILNVYLRKLLGVAVCEGVKGSPDLRSTRVALIGSVFKSDRFVRGPGHLYGADDYFEDVIPEAELQDRLRRLVGGAGSALPAHPPAPPPTGGGEEIERVTGPAATSAGRDQLDPRAEIRRLARIMLSDLKIYHPDEFRKAVLERRFFETFREELTNGKDLIVRRFPALQDRLEVLAGALREGLERERGGPAAQPAGSAR